MFTRKNLAALALSAVLMVAGLLLASQPASAAPAGPPFTCSVIAGWNGTNLRMSIHPRGVPYNPNKVHSFKVTWLDSLSRSRSTTFIPVNREYETAPPAGNREYTVHGWMAGKYCSLDWVSKRR